MQLSILKHFRSALGTARPHVDVSKDADDLIQLWGNAAYERATDLSWREDSGLALSPRPGHWWSVRREVGRRLGQVDREPSLDIAA